MIEALRCPKCGGQLSDITVAGDPQCNRRLECLACPSPRAIIIAAIRAELERQSDEPDRTRGEHPATAPYVSERSAFDENGGLLLIDGTVNVPKIADAILAKWTPGETLTTEAPPHPVSVIEKALLAYANQNGRTKVFDDEQAALDELRAAYDERVPTIDLDRAIFSWPAGELSEEALARLRTMIEQAKQSARPLIMDGGLRIVGMRPLEIHYEGKFTEFRPEDFAIVDRVGIDLPIEIGAVEREALKSIRDLGSMECPRHPPPRGGVDFEDLRRRGLLAVEPGDHASIWTVTPLGIRAIEEEPL